MIKIEKIIYYPLSIVYSCRRQAGFTLVELLVVIAILGLLATIGLGSFRSTQIKSRDSQRKSDLSQIQKALEMYYNDHGQYPSSIPAGGGSWQDEEGTLYMKKVPKDPKDPAHVYLYQQRDSGAGYTLYARLENTNDPCFKTGVCKDYGLSCGSGNCNYGIASSNIAL